MPRINSCTECTVTKPRLMNSAAAVTDAELKARPGCYNNMAWSVNMGESCWKVFCQWFKINMAYQYVFFFIAIF